jgi:hypothetical protein
MWKRYIDSVVRQEDKQMLVFFEPANSKDLNTAERKLKTVMPDSLASFLRESNGISKDNEVIICSTIDIIKCTLEARKHMPWRQYPGDYKGHVFFSTTNDHDDYFSIKRDNETGEEKVYIWEGHNSCGIFMCESLKRWLKIWLSVDMSRYYRGPQHLQEIEMPVAEKIQKHLTFQLSDYQEEYCWQRQIACSCGGDNSFQLFYYGKLLEDGGIADTEEFCQREEIGCAECNKRILLFDAHQHGYDPVVCGFPETPEEEYSKRNANQPYICECGNKAFHFVATASYDSSFYEMIELETQRELDECYGWFTVEAICSECSKNITVISYECA